MINAIAYYRCSNAKQDKSVAEQREMVHARVARDGYRLIREFEEEGFSAKEAKLKRRSEFQNLHTYVKSGQATRDGVKAFLFWKLNRVGRGPVYVISLIQLLKEHGIKLVSMTEDLDPESKTGRLLISMIAATDEFFLDSLSEDVTRGMRSVAAEGLWPYGRPPYGYRAESQGRASRLVVDPAEAEVVRLAFDTYEAGNGDKVTAAKLTAQGLRPPESGKVTRARGQGTWYPKNVADMITNPVYTGSITFGGEVVHASAHEAIIEPERWVRLQAARRQRARTKERGKASEMGSRGLLLPWLRCGHCGGKLHVQHGAPGRYHYACAVRTRQKSACSGVNARVDLLDEMVWNQLQEQVLHPGVIRAAADRWRAGLAGHQGDGVAAKRAELEARIVEAEAVLKRTATLLARGIVAEEEVADELRLQRAARDAARDAVRLLPPPVEVPEMSAEDIQAFTGRLLTAMRAKPLPARREALGQLLTGVTLIPGKVTVSYRPRHPAAQPEVATHGGPEGSW